MSSKILEEHLPKLIVAVQKAGLNVSPLHSSVIRSLIAHVGSIVMLVLSKYRTVVNLDSPPTLYHSENSRTGVAYMTLGHEHGDGEAFS